MIAQFAGNIGTHPEGTGAGAGNEHEGDEGSPQSTMTLSPSLTNLSDNFPGWEPAYTEMVLEPKDVSGEISCAVFALLIPATLEDAKAAMSAAVGDQHEGSTGQLVATLAAFSDAAKLAGKRTAEALAEQAVPRKREEPVPVPGTAKPNVTAITSEAAATAYGHVHGTQYDVKLLPTAPTMKELLATVSKGGYPSTKVPVHALKVQGLPGLKDSSSSVKQLKVASGGSVTVEDASTPGVLPQTAVGVLANVQRKLEMVLLAAATVSLHEAGWCGEGEPTDEQIEAAKENVTLTLYEASSVKQRLHTLAESMNAEEAVGLVVEMELEVARRCLQAERIGNAMKYFVDTRQLSSAAHVGLAQQLSGSKRKANDQERFIGGNPLSTVPCRKWADCEKRGMVCKFNHALGREKFPEQKA
eukprot:CAMPEP_0119161650 /NCGR_PEP_ID=MMETSP1315-20130426/1565_1 /TAXON_ID=676789 /ORGANISM="Prasinoderma singularis, Strain RCC927" /LENGTH=414 /DNA_ID=CAMNT_0007154411 /DNA_START=129 /DNA_END=1373 /DNA_ORIENTATION=-